jgi:transcriptional regulator with XRE-family HTH domain
MMTAKSRRPDSMDVLVGRRMRQRRTLIGMTQERLAAALGITFQQVQKYERGINRVSASRLAQLADALDVPIAYFFQDSAAPEPAQAPLPVGAGAMGEAHGTEDQMSRRETLELVRNYYRISDQKVRQRVRELVRFMGRE